MDNFSVALTELHVHDHMMQDHMTKDLA